MTILTRDWILKHEDLPRELVEVPEWGGSVYIRCLTAAERDAWEASVVNLEAKGKQPKTDLRNLRAKLVVRCACDEAGNRIFQDSDIDALGGKSAAAMDRLYSVAARLSKISKSDEEELLGN